MELHSINCYLSTRIKIDKKTANAYACYEKYIK